MRCHIKICGICNAEDLKLVATSGANYAGVLVDIPTGRGVPFEQAKRLFASPRVPMVAVLMDPPMDRVQAVCKELSPSAIQLHGEEPADLVGRIVHSVTCEVWKVVHAPAVESGQELSVRELIEQANLYIDAGVTRIIMDATVRTGNETMRGGTGKRVDWNLARQVRDSIRVPMILAGGIRPDNVIQAIRTVDPYAIDCSSGVEAHRCKKDPVLVETLIARARVAARTDETDQE